MIRAFLALLLDPPARTAIQALQDSLRQRMGSPQEAAVRMQWVPSDHLHITWKFLGQIEEAGLEDIRQTMEPILATATAAPLVLSHLGGFPDAKAPRVLWLGSEPGPEVDRLVDLVGTVDQALALLGYEPERRAYSPHVTLARVKEGARQVGLALARSGLLERHGTSVRCDVTAVHLMESELRPSGPVYRSRWALPLGHPLTDRDGLSHPH